MRRSDPRFARGEAEMILGNFGTKVVMRVATASRIHRRRVAPPIAAKSATNR